jgi:hypothetical protein
LLLILLLMLLLALLFAGGDRYGLDAAVALQNAHAVDIFVAVATQRLHIDDVAAVILLDFTNGLAHGALAGPVAVRVGLRQIRANRQQRRQ